MTAELAKQLPLSDVPAAWQGADLSSIEEVVSIEKNKQPEDILLLDAFLITDIEEIDTTFGKRHKYAILTPDGEEWIFTLGASSQNGMVGKLMQARLDFFAKYQANPRQYVAALESVPTKLGNDGYRFTTPIQKKLNAEARAGRSDIRRQEVAQGLREPVTAHKRAQEEAFIPDYEERPSKK